MPDIITEPELATPAWISEVLGTSITAVTGHSRIGTGQMSRNYRLDIQGEDPAAPTSIVIKVPASEAHVREIGSQAYVKEVAFYRELASSLEASLPHCHLAEISESGQEFTLVLEDMAPAQQGDQLGGCSVEDARRSLVNLAGAQGPRWNDPSLREVPVLMPSDASILRDFFPIAHQQFLDRYSAQLTDTCVSVLAGFTPRVLEWVEHQPGPFGLVHGDYRLDNLLFTDTRVTAVDWQTIGLGPPARDAAYFLGNSLLIETREQAEEGLLADYLEALHGHGVTDYDMAALQADYALGSLQGPLITVLGAFTATQTDRGDEMFIAMANRSAAQIHHWDALSRF